MEETPQKIKRVKPKKKWSEEEINTILNYLFENGNVEAPTAQIYYRKLIEKTHINASWDLIRWKVRHLKSTFTKASDWRKSTGAGLLECDNGVSTVEGKILQMCQHFHQLSAIFGEKRVDDALPFYDSGEVTSINYEYESTNYCNNTVPTYDTATYLSDSETINTLTLQPAVEPTNAEEVTIETPTSVTKKSKEFAEKLRKHAPKSSASYLAAFQEERTAMYKMKFEWEKEKHERDVMVESKRIKLEEEKFKAQLDLNQRELNLKEKELAKDEKLAVLALEKDERIKMYELQLKYKAATAD